MLNLTTAGTNLPLIAMDRKIPAFSSNHSRWRKRHACDPLLQFPYHFNLNYEPTKENTNTNHCRNTFTIHFTDNIAFS